MRNPQRIILGLQCGTLPGIWTVGLRWRIRFVAAAEQAAEYSTESSDRGADCTSGSLNAVTNGLDAVLQGIRYPHAVQRTIGGRSRPRYKSLFESFRARWIC